jgi:hypothetical protein
MIDRREFVKGLLATSASVPVIPIMIDDLQTSAIYPIADGLHKSHGWSEWITLRGK